MGDIDGDGRPDLLLGQVGPRFDMPGPVVLLRNRDGESFEDVTRASGLAGYAIWSATFGDLDNDGDEDLVLGGVSPQPRPPPHGGERVLENDGRGRFADRTVERIAPSTNGVPVSLDLADLDLDGRLDILSGTGGVDVNRLYRGRALLQQGDGSFRALAPLPDDEGFTWVALASDIDRDGRPDFFFAHDGFALNEVTPVGPATSCEPDLPGYTVRAGWLSAAYTVSGDPGQPVLRREPFAAYYTSAMLTPMGIAPIDHDGDGRLAYFMTNTFADALFVDDPRGGFTDVAPAAGLTLAPPTARATPVSWSALARDLDRDGDDDLLVTRGVVIDSREPGRNVFFVNDAGHFAPSAAASGFDREGPWSALAAADFDGDGDDDLVLGAQTLYLRRCDVFPRAGLLLRNELTHPGRHWLRIRLTGTVSPRDAIGARIEARVGNRLVVREASRGGATMASGDRTVDLGLGPATRVDHLTIRWPSGLVQTLTNVPADQLLRLEEPRWLEVSARAAAPGAAVTVALHGVTEKVRWTLHGGRWLAPPTASGGRFTGEGDVVVGATSTTLHGGVRVRFAR